eukprot:4115313-Pyramimonas_sp.AAC.1
MHVEDFIPHFKVKAAHAQTGQPKQFKVQTMHNALAVRPFADKSSIAAVNRARGQLQGDGLRGPTKPPAISEL